MNRPPKPPLTRIVERGAGSSPHICPKCGSTMKRTGWFGWFGNLKCIQPLCGFEQNDK